MAEWFNKLKNAVMGEPDDYEENYDEGYENFEEVEANNNRNRDVISFKNFGRGRAGSNNSNVSTGFSPFRQPQRNMSNSRGYSNNVVSISTNVDMQVVVSTPSSLEDASQSCEDLKDRKILLVNLEGLDAHLAQRIIDFFSGACYALDGSIQPVSNRVFIIGPEYVNISGQIKEELEASGIKLPNAFMWAR